MKFDCIIMNPPYVRNLHLKILAEAIKHLKDEKSVCVNLSPSTWASKYNICQPKGKWRNKFNGKIDSLYFIPHDEANRLFGTGNAIEDLLITTYKTNGNFNILKYGFNSEVEYSLFKKINIFSDNKNIMTVRQACNNGAYGTGNDAKNIVRKEFDVPIYQWHSGKTCRDAVVIKVTNRKASLAFYFNSTNERQNFLNSLDTKFMDWYYMNFIVPGDCKIVAYMFRMSDYTQPWDDARFYKFFNITPEEQKVIESISS